MTNEEAISILKNAAFLSTKTKYQAIEEAVNTAIEALKAQDGTDVNGDTIYRQAAIEVVSSGCQEFRGIFARCEKNLNELPPAQPERRNGEWIEDDSDWFETMFKCSECGALIKKEDKFRSFFCYHCGADMRGKQE